MNYELAKRLKDAGFPQDKAKEALANVLTMDGGSTATVVRNMPKAIPTTQVAMPTLEELIEACGDGFHSITKFKQSPGNGKWKASYTGEFSGETTYQGKGSTPTEAVALLWISLNKN